MFILLHAKPAEVGEYRFEVTAMIGERHTTRYGKASVTNCNSARSARSFANGLEQGYSEAVNKAQIEIIQTATFKAEFDKEMEA